MDLFNPALWDRERSVATIDDAVCLGNGQNFEDCDWLIALIAQLKLVAIGELCV